MGVFVPANASLERFYMYTYKITPNVVLLSVLELPICMEQPSLCTSVRPGGVVSCVLRLHFFPFHMTAMFVFYLSRERHRAEDPTIACHTSRRVRGATCARRWRWHALSAAALNCPRCWLHHVQLAATLTGGVDLCTIRPTAIRKHHSHQSSASHATLVRAWCTSSRSTRWPTPVQNQAAAVP